MAIVPSWGGYSDAAVTWVILGLLVVCGLFWSTRREVTWALPVRFIAPAAWLGLCALSGFAALIPNLLLYGGSDWSSGQLTLWGRCFLVVTYGFGLKFPEARWVRHLRFAALAATVGVMGVQVITLSPAPLIDVWTVQQRGAESLLAGGNPFHDVHLQDTGPRVASDVPYVYPPMHLYVSSLAWALTQDVRFGSVFALILLGFAVRALARKHAGEARLPAILEDAPALFIWCTPMLAFIVEQGWIDPLQLCWCGAVLLAWKRPWLLAVLAGCLLGAKQTMALMVVPVGLALRLNFRQWLVIGVVWLIPLLPWLILDAAAYKHANFDFLNALPVRDDALTVVVWAQRRLHLPIPWAVGFGFAALVIGLAGVRGPQTISRAAITVLTAMTFFFVFNKWAFANYYFTLLSLAALAAAANLKLTESIAPAGDAPRDTGATASLS